MTTALDGGESTEWSVNVNAHEMRWDDLISNDCNAYYSSEQTRVPPEKKKRNFFGNVTIILVNISSSCAKSKDDVDLKIIFKPMMNEDWGLAIEGLKESRAAVLSSLLSLKKLLWGVMTSSPRHTTSMGIVWHHTMPHTMPNVQQCQMCMRYLLEISWQYSGHDWLIKLQLKLHYWHCLHKWHWHTGPQQTDQAWEKSTQLALWDLREIVCNGTMPNRHDTFFYEHWHIWHYFPAQLALTHLSLIKT